MSLRNRWTHTQLRKLMAPVLNGAKETSIYFDTIDDTKNFRFACYNLRRRKNIWHEYSFILISHEQTHKPGILIQRAPIVKAAE